MSKTHFYRFSKNPHILYFVKIRTDWLRERETHDESYRLFSNFANAHNHNTVFAQFWLTIVYRCFGTTCRVHLQDACILLRLLNP